MTHSAGNGPTEPPEWLRPRGDAGAAHQDWHRPAEPGPSAQQQQTQPQQSQQAPPAPSPSPKGSPQPAASSLDYAPPAPPQQGRPPQDQPPHAAAPHAAAPQSAAPQADAPQGAPQQNNPPGLEQINLIKRKKPAPRSGWRRAVHTLSGGLINPGDSEADQELEALTERVRQPLRGDFRIAVLSLKGGVGKTTTSFGLGATFASLRGDRVIAVDANPDLGTLSGRLPSETGSTVRDLLAAQSVERYSDVSAHTSQSRSRLEVLASERDPAVSEAFSEDDYRRAIDILQHHYNIIITDCGTGLMHSAMNGVLDLADAIVLITSPAIDGAQSASATLDWLVHHGFSRLVGQSVVVISSVKPGEASVDVDKLAQHFLGRTRAVQVVPYDQHLSEGSHIDLDLLGDRTRRAFVELAATVADSFPTTARRLR